jgi:hypothetical protein
VRDGVQARDLQSKLRSTEAELQLLKHQSKQQADTLQASEQGTRCAAMAHFLRSCMCGFTWGSVHAWSAYSNMQKTQMRLHSLRTETE